MTERELCEKCGAPLYAEPVRRSFARLCPRHLNESLANAPVFVDGNGNVQGCVCDGPCPECPSGKPRKSCPICQGYGTLCCEFPCWQRVGLTAQPCCPGCPPLPEPNPEPRAEVVPLKVDAPSEGGS